MKQQFINQEILIVTKSGFSSRQFTTKDGAINENTNTPAEELEKACWNGLLNEWLPELIAPLPGQDRSFIWNIASGAHSLCVSLGPCPMPQKNGSSIDPQFFIHSLSHN